MDVCDRLRRIAETLPEHGSVTLSRADLLELVEAALTEAADEPLGDYTVAQVGDMFQRSPQTVRDWIKSGRLRAYKLNGREYRITQVAVEEFLEQQRNGTPDSGGRKKAADLGAWRDVYQPAVVP
jgi:excisionase family DNA binding protein